MISIKIISVMEKINKNIQLFFKIIGFIIGILIVLILGLIFFVIPGFFSFIWMKLKDWQDEIKRRKIRIKR